MQTPPPAHPAPAALPTGMRRGNRARSESALEPLRTPPSHSHRPPLRGRMGAGRSDSDRLGSAGHFLAFPPASRPARAIGPECIGPGRPGRPGSVTASLAPAGSRIGPISGQAGGCTGPSDRRAASYLLYDPGNGPAPDDRTGPDDSDRRSRCKIAPSGPGRMTRIGEDPSRHPPTHSGPGLGRVTRPSSESLGWAP